VSKAEKIIEQMRRSPQNVRFDDLARLEAEKDEESDDDA
jgi:hypothetical protein